MYCRTADPCLYTCLYACVCTRLHTCVCTCLHAHPCTTGRPAQRQHKRCSSSHHVDHNCLYARLHIRLHSRPYACPYTRVHKCLCTQLYKTIQHLCTRLYIRSDPHLYTHPCTTALPTRNRRPVSQGSAGDAAATRMSIHTCMKLSVVTSAHRSMHTTSLYENIHTLTHSSKTLFYAHVYMHTSMHTSIHTAGLQTRSDQTVSKGSAGDAAACTAARGLQARADRSGASTL